MPWFRVIIEGILIVSSILLAFGIDAWWDELGEREYERDTLINLREDFRGHIEMIDTFQKENRSRVDAADLLLASSDRSTPEFSEVQLLQALERVHVWMQLLIPKGTLGSLLEGQGLSVIQSAALRTALVEWTQQLKVVDETNSYMIEVVTQLEDYLAPRFPMRALRLLGEASNPPPDGTTSIGPTPFPAHVRPLLLEMEFENHVVRGRDVSYIGLIQSNRWAASARRVIELIDQELGTEGPRNGSKSQTRLKT